jgi:hypothetical protein
MSTVKDRRKISDRRTKNLPVVDESSIRPDRRLNNIFADWLSDNIFPFNPVLQKASGLNREK